MGWLGNVLADFEQKHDVDTVQVLGKYPYYLQADCNFPSVEMDMDEQVNRKLVEGEVL